MNKREYKKAVTSLGTGICVQMFLIANSTKGYDMEAANGCISRVWNAMDEARKNANIFFGKKEREFADKGEYLKARRLFFVKLFQKLNNDFSSQIDEALKDFNAAAPKK